MVYLTCFNYCLNKLKFGSGWYRGNIARRIKSCNHAAGISSLYRNFAAWNPFLYVSTKLAVISSNQNHNNNNDSQFFLVAWSSLKTQLDFLNHLINSNKMENVPICYQNSKLQYFSHYQFLYYRLLGKEKEKKKKISGICFITLIIIYYKTRDPKIF